MHLLTYFASWACLALDYFVKTLCVLATSNSNGLGKIVARDPTCAALWGSGVWSEVFPGFHCVAPWANINTVHLSF
jgi:hypothetical protein